MIKQLLLAFILPLTIYTAAPAQSGEIRLIFDATSGVQELEGSEKINLYSIAAKGRESQVEWSANNQTNEELIGSMELIGNNRWSICFNPRSYLNAITGSPLSDGNQMNTLNLVFRNNNNALKNKAGIQVTIDLESNQPMNNIPGVTIEKCENDILRNKKEFVMNNYPNPLKTNTQISYQLTSNAERVSISIYDMIGQKVKSFHASNQKAGLNKFNWNGDDDKGALLKNGLYFYTLEVDGSKIRSNRMVISR